MRLPLSIVLTLLASCGSSQAPRRASQPFGDDVVARTADPVRASRYRGDRVAQGPVGAQGGSLELSSGVKLVVAEGALTETIDLTLSLGDDPSSLGRTDDEKRVGPSVNVMPAVQGATTNAFTLRVPFATLPDGFSAGDVALAVESPHEDQRALQGGVSTRTRWDYFPASVEGNELRAVLQALPGLRVQFVVTR